jgi:hypothetical protein
MSIIKAKTGKIFIPLSIQNSLMDPSYDMIIILREYDEKFHKYNVDREIKHDEGKLAKSYIMRTI